VVGGSLATLATIFLVATAKVEERENIRFFGSAYQNIYRTNEDVRSVFVLRKVGLPRTVKYAGPQESRYILAATVVAIFLIAWSFDAFGFASPISAFLINWWQCLGSRLSVRLSVFPLAQRTTISSPLKKQTGLRTSRHSPFQKNGTPWTALDFQPNPSVP